MGCNCKKDKNGVEIKNESSGKKEPLVIRGLLLVTKSMLFLFGSLIVGIIVIPFSIYMLFKVIFLNGPIDVTDSLLSIGNLLKKKKGDDDDDDEEFEFEDEDELVLLDAE